MFNLSTISKNAVRIYNRAGLIVRKASPNLLVAFGIIGTGAAVIMACQATTKLDEVLTNGEEKLKTIEAAHNGETKLPPSAKYTDEDYRKDLMKAKMHTAFDLAKLYGPSAAIWIASAGCILGGNKIHNVRNAALAAAYKAVDEGFKSYRSNVIAEQGEEADFRYKNNLKIDELQKVMIVDEEGNAHEETRVTRTPDEDENSSMYTPSMYARVFSCDTSKPYWCPNGEYNLKFILDRQHQANCLLVMRGHLFLNEVYDMLGLERSVAGQVVGWVYNGNGDNQVCFGVHEANNGRYIHRNFINGNETDILLDFNVDGNIYDLMEDRDGLRFRRER